MYCLFSWSVKRFNRYYYDFDLICHVCITTILHVSSYRIIYCRSLFISIWKFGQHIACNHDFPFMNKRSNHVNVIANGTDHRFVSQEMNHPSTSAKRWLAVVWPAMFHTPCHLDLMTWEHFPYYWPFVKRSYRARCIQLTKGRVMRMFSWLLWSTMSTNNWVTGYFRRRDAHITSA